MLHLRQLSFRSGITPILLFCFCLSLSLSLSLCAADLGSKAAPIRVSEWVQGPVVTLGGSNTNILVIEFWATWCGPCRVTIPKLNELHQRFQSKGVSFLGLSDESSAVIQPYVKQMGDKMTFSVAADLDSSTSKAYLGGFGVRGIPHAFVINREGNVVWQGHPLNGLDQAIEGLVAGTFDVRKAKAAGEFTEDLQRYLVLTSTSGTSPESIRLGKKMLLEVEDQPSLLRRLAEMILTDGRIRGRDLPLALEAASKANQATGGKLPEYLETYSRALFDSGKQEEAIQVQRDAVTAAPNAEARAAAQRHLEDYQKRLASTR